MTAMKEAGLVVMKRKRLLLGICTLLIVGLGLTGCTSNLAGLEQTGQTAVRGAPQNLAPVSQELQAQGIMRSIGVPGSSSGSLYGIFGGGGYGDWDWYNVQNVSAGDTLTVTLQATGNFDIGIFDNAGGGWLAFDDAVYTRPKAIQTTVINTNDTWIWVGAWESNGEYIINTDKNPNRAFAPPAPTSQSPCVIIKTQLEALRNIEDAAYVSGPFEKLQSALNDAGSDAWTCIAGDQAIALDLLGTFGNLVGNLADGVLGGPLSSYISSLFYPIGAVSKLLSSWYKVDTPNYNNYCPIVYQGKFQNLGFTSGHARWLGIYICTHERPPLDYDAL